MMPHITICPYKSLLTSFITYDFIRREGAGVLKLNYDLNCVIGEKYSLSYFSIHRFSKRTVRMTVVVKGFFVIDNICEKNPLIYCYMVESVLDCFTMFESI